MFEKKKINDIIKENKINIYVFSGMLAFVFIICSNFLHMHFAQDTYCVYSFGWDNYIKIFLSSNRIFSALLLLIYKVLNISLEIGVIISSIIAILAVSSAWFILYKYTIKLVGKEKKLKYNIFIGIATFLIVFNFCTFETNVFMESGIMALSILLSIIAACLYADKKYIKSFIALIISSFCYQGTIGLFVIVTLIFIAYKNKGNIKDIFKKSIGAYIFYGITMVVNLVMTKIIVLVINSLEKRNTELLSISEMISTAFKYGKIVLIDNVGIGPKGLYLLAIILLSILFIVTIIKEKKYFHIFEYVVLILTAIIIPILPVLVMPLESQYIEARMCMCFGSILGALALYLMIIMDIGKIKIANEIFAILIIGMAIINSVYFVRASSENMATGYLDRNTVGSILEQINEYEKEHGIEVKNIGIVFDSSCATYYNGQMVLGSTNVRAMITDWAAIPALEYYSGKKYTEVVVPDNIKNEFNSKNWNYYSNEQLLFEGDTLYLCLF